MALDGAFLNAVKNEPAPLINGKVDKVYQPSREEIIILIRTREGSKKLYISANAGSARVHITTKSVDNPQTPPMFCMLLRKRLGGGRLMSAAMIKGGDIDTSRLSALDGEGALWSLVRSCSVVSICWSISIWIRGMFSSSGVAVSLASSPSSFSMSMRGKMASPRWT